MIARLSLYASLMFAGLIAAAFQFGAVVHFAPPEGWLAYTSNPASSKSLMMIKIADFDVEGHLQPQHVFGPFAEVADLAWSPTGEQLAFSDQGKIYLGDVPRGLFIDLTRTDSAPVSAYTPVWSPDGNRLAYLFYSQTQTDLRIFDLKSMATQIIPAPMVTPVIVWTPSGDAVLLVMQVITNNSGFTTNIMRLSLDTGQIVNLTNTYANDTEPAISPDGKKIAFLSNRTGSDQIYLMDADGKNVIQLTNGSDQSAFPDWLSDHQLIFYDYKPATNDLSINTIDLTTQQVQPLTIDAPPVRYALTKDAARIALVVRSGQYQFSICLFSLRAKRENCPTTNLLPSVYTLTWER